jgi:predicted nucleic acid-binding Zn finger protein
MSDINSIIESLRTIKETQQPFNLYKSLGTRFNKAIKIIKEKKLYKLTSLEKMAFWVIIGSNKDYVVLSNAHYCSCDDYYFAVISGKAKGCKHLLAQKLGERLYDYQVIKLNEIQVHDFHVLWRRSLNQPSIRIIEPLERPYIIQNARATHEE